MYANIIAAEGNSTFTVCETETLITSNNITPLGCRGVSSVFLLLAAIYNYQHLFF